MVDVIVSVLCGFYKFILRSSKRSVETDSQGPFYQYKADITKINFGNESVPRTRVRKADGGDTLEAMDSSE